MADLAALAKTVDDQLAAASRVVEAQEAVAAAVSAWDAYRNATLPAAPAPPVSPVVEVEAA